MPIEPSPIPFAQTLPHTPLFDPSAHHEIAPNGTIIGGGGSGMGMGMGAYPGTLISHGPASVAASAIIGPSPGGLAGPHRPIPALPDAGYTAPTLRAASLTGHAQQYGGNLQGYGQSEVQGQGPGSVYAGGSLYGGGGGQYGPQYQQHQAPYIGEGSGYSDGWSASLPAPRRAPIVPLPNPHQHDRGRYHDRSPTAVHHHTRDDFDDGASDASYYAMPRKPRHTRASSQDSSASEVSSPEIRRGELKDDLHRKTLSSNHQAQGQGQRYRSPSASTPTSPGPGHDHSPVSSSPLRSRKQDDGERGPAVTRGRRDSMGPEDGLGLSGLEIDDVRGRRYRRSSHTPGESRSRSYDVEGDRSVRSARPGMERQRSNLRPVEGSISDSEQPRIRRDSVRRRSITRVRRRSGEYRDEVSDDEYSDLEERRKRSPKQSGTGGTRRKASIRQSKERYGRDRKGYEEDESPYHRPTLPVDTSPLLSPHSALDYHEHGSHHTHHHHGRRRANSEHSHHHHHHHQDQREYTPPPQAGTLYPGQSASLVGEDYDGHHHRPQIPISAGSRRMGSQPFPGYVDGGQSVHPLPNQGMYPPNGQGFDDGASMVMDAQTMGGRVSQYGLPKYAHNPKVDYRRFCVQRGNADVFID